MGAAGRATALGCTAVDLVHRDDAKHLHALGALLRLADHARALEGGLQTAAAQNGHMQKNVRRAVVRNDEAIAFRDVEPFDAPGDLDKIESLFAIGGGWHGPTRPENITFAPNRPTPPVLIQSIRPTQTTS